jgi:hypothetical protein
MVEEACLLFDKGYASVWMGLQGWVVKDVLKHHEMNKIWAGKPNRRAT